MDDKALTERPVSGAKEATSPLPKTLRPKRVQELAAGQYRFGPLSWIIAFLMVWNIWSFLSTATVISSVRLTR